jgi:hypothetical protein
MCTFALVFGMSANLTNLGNLKFFADPTSFVVVFVPIVGTLLNRLSGVLHLIRHFNLEKGCE